MAGANFKIENLDALGRARDRVAELRDGGKQVITRAVGTLKRRLVPWMKRDIGAQFTLPSRKIGARLRCKGDENSVTMTALGRAQTLTNFPNKQTSTGVRVEIEKGKPLEIPHAFLRVPIGTANAIGPQAFIRDAALGSLPDDVVDIATIDGSNRKQRDKHGYPITLLGGPSVADMMATGDRVERAIEFGHQLFADEVDRLTEAAHGG